MNEFEILWKKEIILFLSLRIYSNKIKYIPNKCDSYDIIVYRTLFFERYFPIFMYK